MNSLKSSPPSSISFVENCLITKDAVQGHVRLFITVPPRSTRLRSNPDEMLCSRAGAKAKMSIMHDWSIAASKLR